MSHAIALPLPAREYLAEEIAAAAFLSRYTEPTRSRYALDLRIFFEWCADHQLRPLEVERAHLEFFARHLEETRHNVASSVASRLSTLRGFFLLAEADDRIVKSPAKYLKMPRVIYDETRALGLDRTAMSALIYTSRTLKPEDEALVALMGLLGLRVSEACSVNIEDFAGVERGHQVLHLVGKGGKPATIPLPPAVLRSLRRCAGDRDSGPLIVRRDGHRLDRHTAYRWIKRIGKKAGVDPRIHPHTLRHGAITAALDAGAPLRDAQVFARHSDPRVTTRYDRGRLNLDRHAAYNVTAYLSGAA